MKHKQILHTLCLLFIFYSSSAQFAGTLDPSFGGTGIVTTDFTPYVDGINAIVIQPDGKIIAGGQSYTAVTLYDYDFAIARYNTNGTLDTTFSHDGKILTNFGISDYCNALELEDDLKIVAAGSTFNETLNKPAVAVARYKNDGSPDSSFNGDGKLETYFDSILVYINSVKILPGHKILVAGSITTDHYGRDLLICRYLENGDPDSTFGQNGILISDIQDNEVINNLHLLSGGEFYASGYIYESTASIDYANFFLAKYLGDGTIDSSFGINGTVITSIMNNDWCSTSYVQEDGKIILGGSYLGDFEAYFEIVRYNTDGTADSSFSDDGIATFHFASENYDILNSILVLPDGNIFAGGYTEGAGDGDFLVLKILPDGKADSSFGIDGYVLTDIIGEYDRGNALALQADGKLILGGKSGDGTGGAVFSLCRYFITSFIVAETFILNDIKVRIFPNPAMNSIHLEIPADVENISANIYDAAGRAIYTAVLNGERTINIESLNAGIYFIKLTGNDFSTELMKLIVTR